MARVGRKISIFPLSVYLLLLGALCLLEFSHNVSASEDDEILPSKLSQTMGGPTLKFLYCYSCGYRKTFDQYVSIIQERYRDIRIDGQNYDPPGFNMYMARLIGILKMVIIVCILGAVNIFDYINQPQPGWWVWCTENKLYACMMLFFLANIIEGQLIQSGAFEISLNDVPVWSKLETGRIPQPSELFQIIDNHMQFGDKVELRGGKGFAK